MSISKKLDETLNGLGLNEVADALREESISRSMGNLKTKMSDLDIRVETTTEEVIQEAPKPRFGKTELADLAVKSYKKDINPPDKSEVEKEVPKDQPSTIASRANVTALSRSLAGMRSSGNEGKSSWVGPNGVGNVGKISPTGDNGVGNVTNNVNNYYALTTDMTLEEYEAHVENIFNEVSPGLMKAGQENFDRENRLPDGRIKPLRDRVKAKKEADKKKNVTEAKKKCDSSCECDKCKTKANEDVVHELAQKLVTMGSSSWIEVDKLLRETAKENGVTPAVISRQFRSVHGMYPDKWIKENLEVEICGFMPLVEASRLNKVGTVYEVSFMFRGGTNRLKFFWPSPGQATKEDMQREVEKFWPKARVITFYPTIDNEQQSNYMVMAPPMTENYHFMQLEDWNEMSDNDTDILQLIYEEEGEPVNFPSQLDNGTYEVTISDHETGEQRVIAFGEGWKPKNQAKIDKKIGKVADAEAIEMGKSKKHGRDDAKIDKLYKRQQAMRFGKKMSQIGEAAYPGHDEQGNPLPKKDKRMEVNKADINLPAGRRWMKGDSRYKTGPSLKD